MRAKDNRCGGVIFCKGIRIRGLGSCGRKDAIENR